MQLQANDLTGVMAKGEMLSLLRFDQLQQLRDVMVSIEFSSGEVLAAQGRPADTFFYIHRGSATMSQLPPDLHDVAGNGLGDDDVTVLEEGM